MAFDTQERISELEQMSIKTFKTEMQRKKNKNKHNNIFRDCGTIIKDIYIMRIPVKKKEKKEEMKYFKK